MYKSQPKAQNPASKVQIPASRPKSKPLDQIPASSPYPSLESLISALQPKSQPSSGLGFGAQIGTLWFIKGMFLVKMKNAIANIKRVYSVITYLCISTAKWVSEPMNGMSKQSEQSTVEQVSSANEWM